MNWREATLSQLMVIAYDDPFATVKERFQAQEEIKRRAMKRKKYRRTNYREKVTG